MAVFCYQPDNSAVCTDYRQRSFAFAPSSTCSFAEAAHLNSRTLEIFLTDGVRLNCLAWMLIHLLGFFWIKLVLN